MKRRIVISFCSFMLCCQKSSETMNLSPHLLLVCLLHFFNGTLHNNIGKLLRQRPLNIGLCLVVDLGVVEKVSQGIDEPESVPSVVVTIGGLVEVGTVRVDARAEAPFSPVHAGTVGEEMFGREVP
mmetsp:Transcript_39878/g.56201  ORF Transcript_39878/g.56201 Transcript_39878/m.56201 type:complete len:126 (-) Transcript_39878:777-1154(-)